MFIYAIDTSRVNQACLVVSICCKHKRFDKLSLIQKHKLLGNSEFNHLCIYSKTILHLWALTDF